MSLDYFVLYSSIVSLLGLSGQGNYAAANAFMDALANHRHYHQQAATAFNWGPWGEVGMAVRQHMNVPGIRNLSVKQGLAALSKGLTSTLPQVLVASVNWSHYAKSQAIAPLLLQGLIKESVIKPPMPTTNLKEQLQQAEKDQQLPILEAYLREQVSGVLFSKLANSINEKTWSI